MGNTEQQFLDEAAGKIEADYEAGGGESSPAPETKVPGGDIAPGSATEQVPEGQETTLPPSPGGESEGAEPAQPATVPADLTALLDDGEFVKNYPEHAKRLEGWNKRVTQWTQKQSAAIKGHQEAEAALRAERQRVQETQQEVQKFRDGIGKPGERGELFELEVEKEREWQEALEKRTLDQERLAKARKYDEEQAQETGFNPRTSDAYVRSVREAQLQFEIDDLKREKADLLPYKQQIELYSRISQERAEVFAKCAEAGLSEQKADEISTTISGCKYLGKAYNLDALIAAAKPKAPPKSAEEESIPVKPEDFMRRGIENTRRVGAPKVGVVPTAKKDMPTLTADMKSWDQIASLVEEEVAAELGETRRGA